MAINAVKKLEVEVDALDPLADGLVLYPTGTALLSGKVAIGNASNVVEGQTISGDMTISNAGVGAISAGVIVNADVNANAAIAFSKLATLTDGYIVVGSGANVPTAVAMTGDVTILNTGATAIGAKKVLATMTAIADGKILIGGAGGAGVAQTLSGDVTVTNAGVTAIGASKVTPAMTDQTQAITATTTGATTGTILDTTTFGVVTCDSAAKIVVLPTPTPGRVVTLLNGATGYELRSSAPATVAINGGADTDAESAIPASTIVRMTCVSATNWIGEQFTAAGVKSVVEVAAA